MDSVDELGYYIKEFVQKLANISYISNADSEINIKDDEMVKSSVDDLMKIDSILDTIEVAARRIE